LQPVYERSIGVKFIWGEVLNVNGEARTATSQTMFATGTDDISWDYCMICAGCNFGPFKPMGESLWFPTVHAKGREVSDWKHIDERYYEGRRRHILEEYHRIGELAKKEATVLIVGAGFIGVEWITELEHFFPALKTTIIDMLPRCLGPLPEVAAEYCSEYMNASGINEFYGQKYDAKNPEFWKGIRLPNGPDKEYVCIGVKASNYFLPGEVLSDVGPGGGGWIMINKYLQVCNRVSKFKGQTAAGPVWGGGRVFAVGDCNFGCVMQPDVDPKNCADGAQWLMPPIPKISYPGEEQALHAVHNVERLDAAEHGWKACGCVPWPKPGKDKNGQVSLKATWWPWGAGMFATSLGAHDACFVIAANEKKGSGYMVNWSLPSALQKEIIETTKVNEMKDIWIGKWIWHYVHHTPIHCFGKGAFFRKSI
jgi:hypothetical protein